VVREKAGSAGDVIREKTEAAGDIAREQAVKAGREQTRQAHERAHQRYEGLPKAQVSDLLAKRDLPKTGNIDELIERLVEADSR
jgi:hypothetical protein